MPQGSDIPQGPARTVPDTLGRVLGGTVREGWGGAIAPLSSLLGDSAETAFYILTVRGASKATLDGGGFIFL